MKGVVVFCSASDKVKEEYQDLAEETGRLLVKSGYRVVYGGGQYGLMGKLAQGALAENGEVIGVIPKSLKNIELAQEGLTELHTVNGMHERKQMMSDLSHAVVTLPGGFGTLDEVIEMITWKQLGFHKKPIYFLNTDGFWDPLLQFFENLQKENFVHELFGAKSNYFKVVNSLEELMRDLESEIGENE